MQSFAHGMPGVGGLGYRYCYDYHSQKNLPYYTYVCNEASDLAAWKHDRGMSETRRFSPSGRALGTFQNVTVGGSIELQMLRWVWSLRCLDNRAI